MGAYLTDMADDAACLPARRADCVSPHTRLCRAVQRALVRTAQALDSGVVGMTASDAALAACRLHFGSIGANPVVVMYSGPIVRAPQLVALTALGDGLHALTEDGVTRPVSVQNVGCVEHRVVLRTCTDADYAAQAKRRTARGAMRMARSGSNGWSRRRTAIEPATYALVPADAPEARVLWSKSAEYMTNGRTLLYRVRLGTDGWLEMAHTQFFGDAEIYVAASSRKRRRSPEPDNRSPARPRIE